DGIRDRTVTGVQTCALPIYFHPAANVEKIRHGIPLDDSDRAPWLAALRDSILKSKRERKNLVLACSALKRKYRDELRVDGVQFEIGRASCRERVYVAEGAGV